MSKMKQIQFKYINKSATINIAYRPHITSRKAQYYTRYMPQIIDKNVLWGWVGNHIAPYDISEKCKIVSMGIDDACVISEVLDLPLVITIVEYCNISDKTEIEEVFFWRSSKISHKV